ncbi:MAG: hypothetical protein GX085_02720 [Firmicutes bacterium]|nr:hypothetical protein [Bacillota bacterium]
MARSRNHTFFSNLLFPGFLLGFLFFAGSSPFFAARLQEPVCLLPEEYDVWGCDWGKNGRIVFAGKLQGEEGEKTRLWLYRPGTGGNPLHWTGTGAMMDFSPRWSPQGDGVVMVRRRPESVTGEGTASSIWWKAYPSGEGRRLTSGPWDRDPAWSPEGKRVVFVRGDGPFLSSLAVIPKEGGEVTQLTPFTEGFITAPVWAGTRVYFTRLALEPVEFSLPATERGGDARFRSYKLGKGGVWYLDLTTGEEKPLIVDEHDNRYSAVSPNGRYLAFVSTGGITLDKHRPVRDRAALFVLDLKTGRRYLVAGGVNSNGAAPVWSPDGKKLVFFSFRRNRPAMWVTKWEAE